MDGADVLQNISASSQITITRNKSQALQDCEHEIERIEEQIAKLEEQKASTEGYSSMYMMLAIILMVAFAVCVICMCEIVTGGICGNSGTTAPQPVTIPATPTPAYPPDWLTGNSVVSFEFCASPCMPIMTLAMNAFQMSSKSDDKALEIESQIEQYQAQLEQRQALCSSESFGQLVQAEQGMMPILA
jgi:hypothetical protein